MSLIESLPLLDEGTSTEATHYETGNWSKMPWCTASMRASASGFHPEAFSTTTGSYWSATSFSLGACSVQYVSGGMVSERYVALWVCVNAASHNGYRAQFFENGAGEYHVKMFKVTAGAESLMVESSAVVAELAANTLAFWNNGGNLEAWHHSEAGWSLITSHADSTYTSGFIGIDGSGSNPALKEWKGASSTTSLLSMVV